MIVSQVVILVTGILCARMLTKPTIRVWGYVFPTRPYVFIIGLLGQSAWLYDTILAEQWGTVALSVYWTYCYVTGWLTWIRRPPMPARTCR